MKITFDGWPWQHTSTHWANQVDKTVGERWGWNPFKVKGMGRFGGGWAFKFGILLIPELVYVVRYGGEFLYVVTHHLFASVDYFRHVVYGKSSSEHLV